MKTSKKVLTSAIAATMAFGAMVPAANAEVEASVSVASSYLWRGVDLGSGTPAVSGDLSYANSGFYTGVWTSSGDTAAGSEYDLYIGYGAEFGGFSIDASVWNYVYPSYSPSEITAESDADSGFSLTSFVDQEDGFGDLSELVVSLGFGPVSATIYQNLNGAEYQYVTLGAGFGDYSVTLGSHLGDDSPKATHLDFSYAYSDNLNFTFSQFIKDNNDSVDDDMKVVVSYSLPLGK